MPERNNIQTYERVLDGQSIHQIGKFATFLNDVQLLETPALEHKAISDSQASLIRE